MLEWLKKQYGDIKGNFKWAIVCWLVAGSGLTWLAHFLQAVLHANIGGWLNLAAPIFSILAIGYFLVVVKSTPGFVLPPSIDDQNALASASVPSLPRPVDLRGEILEMYFYGPQDFMAFSFAPKHILCKVLIVNHGPDQATITHCGLQISLGDFQRLAETANIPDAWHIRKKKTGVLGFGYEDLTIAPALGAPAESETYSKGIPRIGWLAFELHSFGEDVEFPNAEFILHLKDSLGGQHCIRKGPGVYTRTGEIVVAATKPLPSPRAS